MAVKLRCIVWGINYAPELTGIAPYNTALCEFLCAQGHEARMVTSFAYYPEWKKRPADKGRWFRTDVVQGVRVHRCWHYVPRKPSALRRIWHELTFVMTSFLRILTLPRPDVYVVVSPPLLLGLAAWLASMLKSSCFVFHVQDLQPDAASGLGMVKKGLLLRSLYALESFSYRKAIRVSGITAGMIRAFQRKGVAGAKTLLFPNGIDLSASRPAPPPGNFRRRMGLAANDVLAVYSGNLGAKHGVEILLEAARRLQDAPITIVICGEGASRPLLERRASELGLKNALLLPLQPAAEYLEMMVDTDIYFVTQQPGSRSLFFPSKLLPGLALAKAVVVVADPESELTSAAREGEFAVVVNPSQPEELAKVVRQLAAAPGQRKSLGAVGRRYVEQFEQGRLLRVFAEQLCEVVSGPCQPVPGPTKPAVSPHESVT